MALSKNNTLEFSKNKKRRLKLVQSDTVNQSKFFSSWTPKKQRWFLKVAELKKLNSSMNKLVKRRVPTWTTQFYKLMKMSSCPQLLDLAPLTSCLKCNPFLRKTSKEWKMILVCWKATLNGKDWRKNMPGSSNFGKSMRWRILLH